MNHSNSIQIINQKTKDVLNNRLKRDELTKILYEKNIRLRELDILIENEHFKMAKLKITMYSKMIETNNLYIKNRINNIKMDIKIKELTEKKLQIVKEMIIIDNANLSQNFNTTLEVKIGELTDQINYEFPENWEETKATYEMESKKIEGEIKNSENEVKAFEQIGMNHMNTLKNYINQYDVIETEIADIAEKLIPLSDSIVDGIERHPVTYIRLADDEKDILKNLSLGE